MCGAIALVCCLFGGHILDHWHGVGLVCCDLWNLWMALLVHLCIVDVAFSFVHCLTW